MASKWAQFEEKTYESAANGELLEGSGKTRYVLPPGQVAEKILGYDVAAWQNEKADIWKLLALGMPPGVLLLPNFWQGTPMVPSADDLPSHKVSLLLQYKRPKYIDWQTGGQWGYWGGPYYRFSIEEYQHNVLRALEGNLAKRAVVRYACAAFFLKNDLERHLTGSTILANSAFASPSEIGVGHRVWTYQSSGNTGYSNPESHVTKRLDWSSIIALSRSTAVSETLLQHLRALAESMDVTQGLSTDLAWVQSLRSLLHNVDHPLVQGMADFAMISQRLALSGVTWWILDFGSNKT